MDVAVAEVLGQFNVANLENMIRESTKTVYEGSSQNRLQCAIVLFSLCTLYSIPHTFLDALLTWTAGVQNKALTMYTDVNDLKQNFKL